MSKKAEVRSDISLEVIEDREKSEKRKIVADRIRAVRLAKEGRYEYREIAQMLGKKTPSHATKWIRRFNENGFDGLETQKGQGRNQILDSKERAEVEKWVANGPDPKLDGYNVWTALKLQAKIKREFGKKLSERCVRYTLSSLGFHHRKARGIPSKADPKELESFKKSTQKRQGKSRRSRKKDSTVFS